MLWPQPLENPRGGRRAEELMAPAATSGLLLLSPYSVKTLSCCIFFFFFLPKEKELGHQFYWSKVKINLYSNLAIKKQTNVVSVVRRLQR